MKGLAWRKQVFCVPRRLNEVVSILLKSGL
jgi:Trm5-related predicted tRNA methylase